MTKGESNTEREILNLAEAAALLRIQPNTVARLAKAKKIPGKKLGKEWRFSRTALQENLSLAATTKRKAS